MRSRYSAYAKALVPYLLRTWDASTRPADLELDPALHWVALEVLATSGGGEHDETGTVEFAAHHDRGGISGVLHEVSRFRRSDGCWVYLDGSP
jgi:SEC-C motif-containing protein